MNFYIMHATNNRFVIVDGYIHKYIINDNNYIVELIQKLNLCTDFDQFIIFGESKYYNCTMFIYNKDSSLVEACGNATACVASLMYKKFGKINITIDVLGRILNTKYNIDGSVSVNMGKVRDLWSDIPFSIPVNCYHIKSLPDNIINNYGNAYALNIGNPHLIFLVKDIKIINMKDAEFLEKYHLFPKKINISFVENNQKGIFARIWERGVGETQSCGSAACAIYFLLCKLKAINFMEKMYINFLGGIVSVYSDDNFNVWLANQPIIEKIDNI